MASPVLNSTVGAVRHAERTSTAVRIVGLDALRGIAMMLGVLLHSAAAYLVVSPQGLLWPIQDPQRDPVCDAIFWGIHGFRLPIFFVLSGYFAELVFSTRGAATFWQQRLSRLLIPYLVGLSTVGLLTLLVSIWGWHVSGFCDWRQVIDPTRSLPPVITEAGFGPGHLWFLQDLFLMSAVFWLLRRQYVPLPTLPEQSRDDRFRLTRLMPLVLTVPTALLLWGDTSVLTHFRNSFLPEPQRLMYFGSFFVAGVFFFRKQDWFFAATQNPARYVLASLLGTPLMVYFTIRNVEQTDATTAFLASASTAAVIWLAIFGWFGVFLHHWKFQSRRIRYLADASYWVYLAHLPVVIVIQILLYDLNWPPVAKMGVTTLVTLAVTLWTYELFVRYGAIGRQLHGPRMRTELSTETSR